MKKYLIGLTIFLFCATSYGADSEVQDLDAITSPASGDVLYVVDDPAGTPASKKITIGNVLGVGTDLDSSGALSADSVSTDEMADADFGDWSCSGGSCTLDSGVVDAGAIGADAVLASELDVTDVSDDIAADIAEGELADGIIVEADLKAVDVASDEDIFTYETTTGDFEWHSFDEVIANMSEGALPNDSIVEADLKATNAPTDEYFLSYEETVGDFTWVSAAGIASQFQEDNLANGIVTSADLKDNSVKEVDLYVTDAAGDEECLTFEATGSIFEWQACGSGAETNSLETTITGIADTEVFVGNGADSGTFVTVSGDATLANTGALTISANAIEESMLKAVDAPADEECFTYESTTGDFEWQSCGAGSETNSLEADGAVGIADTEVFIGTGAGTGNYAALSGDVTMTNAGVVTVANDSHTHTEANISDLAHTATAITDDLIVNADVNSAAAIAISKTALVAGTNITLSTNTLNVDDAFITNGASDVMTGTLTADGLTLGANENITLGAETLDHDGTDFVFSDSVTTGGTSQSTFPYGIDITTDLEIPNGTAPTVDTAGQVALDTTSDQIVYYGGSKRVVPYEKEVCVSIEDPVDADDNIMFYQPRKAITITDVVCRVDGGTSIPLTISDGTNALEAITCATTATEDDGSITNGTFTALERMEFDLGTPTGTQTLLNFCITYTVDSD